VVLTRNFRETVQARACRDIKFRRALLVQATQLLLDGNLAEGRGALRSSVHATVGFEKLGATLGRSPKSLMRMFGPPGNPTAENLLGVIGVLQEETGVHLEVRAVSPSCCLSSRMVSPMKDEYDFSTAERGKFFRQGARLVPPVHLEPDVLDHLSQSTGC
jgi:hypothetical protein